MGQPRPPDPLHAGASEDDRLMHGFHERESRPRPMLFDPVAIGRPYQERHVIHPLRKPRMDIHLIFARTLPTQEGISDFANAYGMLGCDLSRKIAIEDPVTGKSLLYVAEDERDWADEITDMADAVDLWKMVSERNTVGLSERVRWSDNGVSVEWGERRGMIVASKNSPRAYLLERLEPGDVVEPARLAAARIVNDRLSRGDRVPPRLLWNSDTHKCEYHVMPTGLIGAIWLDLMLAINGELRYRRCRECGDPFAVKPKGKAKTFCSNRCRVRNHRRQRHGRGDGTQEEKER